MTEPLLAAIHPRYGTPWKTNLIFMAFVGGFAAFVPGDIVGDMTSIGTLFAFILVCAGVWILRRRRPDLPRDFRTPLVPLFPILGILVCASMICLKKKSELRLLALKPLPRCL